MNTKILLITIIGIFSLSAVSYLIFSPIAKKQLDEPIVENNYDKNIATTTKADNKNIETVINSKEKPAVNNANTETKTTNTSTTNTTETPGFYTKEQVATHSSKDSCWSIINGGVYDLTSYVSRHPGGSGNILRICGKDGSSAFEGQHGGQSKPEKILESYKIGLIK